MEQSMRKALTDLFGEEDSIPLFRISALLRVAWQGDMCSDGCRAICWRIFLGLLSGSNKSAWPNELAQIVANYTTLKDRVMPSIDKVKDDPLSALSVGDSMSAEWSAYYKNVELTNFIKGDLDRLFLTGLDDEYFQSKEKRDLLTSILFIWSMEHPLISYRQGMHEILGAILYAVESEKRGWESEPDHPLAAAFTEKNVEAYTYNFFERIMMELYVLYDPLPVSGIENQPFVVQYCTKIQEHYLRILDPALCHHLEESFIQSQLYGLRWSRLLLGREFTLQNNQMFRLWDFMFASCYDAEYNSAELLLDDSLPPNVYSLLANLRISGYTHTSNAHKRTSTTERVTYVCTPLLGALGDFMLAMMIQVRDELLAGDSSVVMTTLMRYPEQASVHPVLECADMIRRGVLVRFTETGHSVLNYNYDTMSPSPFNNTPLNQHTQSQQQPQQQSWHTPSRPTAGPKPISQQQQQQYQMQQSSSSKTGGYAENVGKKMSEKLSSLSSAVGAGFSDLVQAIAPMLESAFDDHSEDRVHSASANAGLDHPLATAPSSTKNKSSAGQSLANNPSQSHSSNHKPNQVDAKASDALQMSALRPADDDESSGKSLKKSNSSDSQQLEANEVDPLTGARLSPSSQQPSSTKSSQKAPTTVPIHTPQRTASTATTSTATPAQGANPYGLLFDDHHGSTQHTSGNSSSTTGKGMRSGSLSLFKPREWFGGGGSSHHQQQQQQHSSGSVEAQGGSSSSSAATAALGYHSNRVSTGFHMMPQHHHDHDGSSSTAAAGEAGDGMMPTSHQNPVPFRKKNLVAQNHTVGDRLQDLADYLLQFTGPSSLHPPSSSTSTSTSPVPIAGTAIPGIVDEPNNPPVLLPPQEDAVQAVARRLRALAEVLAGQYSVVDYDIHFASRPMPVTLSLTHMSFALQQQHLQNLQQQQQQQKHPSTFPPHLHPFQPHQQQQQQQQPFSPQPFSAPAAEAMSAATAVEVDAAATAHATETRSIVEQTEMAIDAIADPTTATATAAAGKDPEVESASA